MFKRGIDVVVNFAASTHVDRSLYDPVNLLTPILLEQNLLELSRVYKVSRFHQISTDEVFGDLALDSKDKFSETTYLT